MAKYRAWVSKIEILKEFATEEEARAWGIQARDKWKIEHPNWDLYFDIDDCGSTEEEEE